MADTKPTSPPPPRPRNATSSSASNVAPNGGVRYRMPLRPSTVQSPSPPPRPPEILRRRSSILSFSSLEDATQSFHDDILNPTTSRGQRGREGENEVTHWHSTPLAFAILPAVAGLLFKNGSAFVTDALLIVLAAIFMNWSIRIPWDWYYSAQTIKEQIVPSSDSDTIIEEGESVDTAITTSPENSPKQKPVGGTQELRSGATEQLESARESALADLRRQEVLALASTFIFPALAAYLLHVIRAQLSRPSTSLVSDYNLSIFLLAAEIRPVRQLVRLVANRTLHLQRAVTRLEDPYSGVTRDQSIVNSLVDRVTELEARLAEHQVIPPTVNLAHKADVSDLSVEMRKRYEPRLEGLERAVRRYEKRSTTLAMSIEQRLNSLDTRLQDALSLAAAAAKQSQKRGFVGHILETVGNIIAVPLKISWMISIYPLTAFEELYIRLKNFLFGPIPPRSSKSKQGSQEGRMDEKPRLKLSSKKAVR